MKLAFVVLLTIGFVAQAMAGKKPMNRVISSSEVKEIKCSGTEPFFGISGNPTKMKFTSPDNEKGKSYRMRGLTDALGVMAGNAMAMKSYDGRLFLSLLHKGLAGSICNDGMSDNEYDYHLIAIERNVTYYGCCSLVK